MLLNELDRRGRVRGAAVCELDEALDFLRELAEQGRRDREPRRSDWDHVRPVLPSRMHRGVGLAEATRPT